MALTRRGFLAAGGAAAAAGLAGCASSTTQRFTAETAPTAFYDDPGPDLPPGDTSYAEVYGSMTDDGYVIPAVPYHQIDPQFWRQIVEDPTGEDPGTIVVDPNEKLLYHVHGDGTATRYGVGVGRAGFGWSGRGQIQAKKHWPTWTPPSEMIDRQPELAKYSAKNGGMDPGLMNPLGARAMYIFQDGHDTLYRVHGSPEWNSIGKAVSSGCIRMMNQDVIHLYSHVQVHSPILVV
ncbi:L,D-transpeptidase [Pararhizobium mangrovi]|uniref:L,D-transpeptidase n=2 Tax=Pararhizobium mangrovi TaxID=2590452 RepID=A0A506U1I1_9HYPH|nr:L,D-transpeptidase [Pararhizobium mangrovi]